MEAVTLKQPVKMDRQLKAGSDYMFRYDPISYILKEGNIYCKLQLYDVLGCSRPDLIGEYLTLQNTDGGWPWELKNGNPSSVAETARAVRFLKDKNGYKSEIEKTIPFLLEHQREDGGWAENLELVSLIPKEWDWMSCYHSSTSTTGSVICALLEGIPREDSRLQKALYFLKKTQTEDGGWPYRVGPGYRYGTDIASVDDVLHALIAVGESKDSPVIQKAIGALQKNYHLWTEPIDASSAISILHLLGYPADHPWIQELVSNIFNAQHENGGWNWLGDFPTSPGITLFCVEQLITVGAVTTDELKNLCSQ